MMGLRRRATKQGAAFRLPDPSEALMGVSAHSMVEARPRAFYLSLSPAYVMPLQARRHETHCQPHPGGCGPGGDAIDGDSRAQLPLCGRGVAGGETYRVSGVKFPSAGA